MSKPDYEIQHLVMMSGGICSWATGKRVVERFGRQNTVYLFADTFIEDDDLYRFLIQGSANLAGVDLGRKFDKLYGDIPPLEKMDERKELLIALADYAMQEIPGLVWINEGRSPWEVMADQRIIGNAKIDPCSSVLKRRMLDRWRNENTAVEHVTIYLGLDWTESMRVERVNLRCAPWRYQAPMTEKPYLEKDQMIALLRAENICPPRLYGMGFSHNNCGGFCIKAGQAHFAHLLRTMPKRYAYHEAEEEKLRGIVGDHAILRDRTGGTTKQLTLKAFRERLERQGEFDMLEWGGCHCAIPE